MTVYKLVNEQLQSLYAHCFPETALQYKIGEAVKPKIGKIFAFHSLNDARVYDLGVGHDSYLYIAEASNITTAETRMDIEDVRHTSSLVYFWEDIKRWQIGRGVFAGTVFCDDLKLIERIK